MVYDKVVDSAVLDGALQATADAIKHCTGTETVEWNREYGFAAAVADVYNAGEMTGVETGKQTEYDRFWDLFQQNGEKVNWQNAFNNQLWTDEIYNPKYPIVSTSGNSIFANTSITDTKVTVDLSAASNATSMCSWGKIKTFRKLIVHEGLTFSNAFYNAQWLEELTVEGIVGQSIDLHWSTKLSKASIESVINALSDTATGKTVTFSKTAVTNAFSTDGDGLSVEWVELISTKPNWTFVLDSTALCTFSINDDYGNIIPYFFQQGMTWGEFVNSIYNLDGAFAVDEDVVQFYHPYEEYEGAFGDVGDSNTNYQFTDDTITAGEVYQWHEL